VGESAILTLAGVAAGVGLLYALLIIGQPLILSKLGIFIAVSGLSAYELCLMAVIGMGGVIIGFIPGYQLYRYSLADGLTIRL
jgi:putative ABC transport system permease protein